MGGKRPVRVYGADVLRVGMMEDGGLKAEFARQKYEDFSRVLQESVIYPKCSYARNMGAQE